MIMGPGDDTLRALARQHWKFQIPAILNQAEIEAPHNTQLSDTLQGAKDNSEGRLLINILLSCIELLFQLS